MNVSEVLRRLEALAEPRNVENKARRFGINAHNALGVNQKALTLLAREIGSDNELAVALFDTGLYEARLLCSKLFDPNELSSELMERWASGFENWEICDSFCMGFFARSKLAQAKAEAWSRRPELYVKRAAFAIIAGYGFAHKNAENRIFEDFLVLVKQGSSDERHYVRKAVSWALRNIGKRNRDLRASALMLARELQCGASPAAQWIGRDALRELDKPTLRLLNYPRTVYGPRG